jgi:hypothetical protein
MRIVFGILAASVFVAAAATAQSSPAGPETATMPFCVTCYNPSNPSEGCTANYGVPCGPNEEFDHCTEAQAAAWCPGWSNVPPPVTPICAVCHGGEASEDSCYANYGAQCTPPVPGPAHCTEAQAAAWCAGWTQKMATLNQTATPDP